MLGCNESNIIFQQHLCKLGQRRRGVAPILSRDRTEDDEKFCTALPIWKIVWCRASYSLHMKGQSLCVGEDRQ